jgi:hypothetical protein
VPETESENSIATLHKEMSLYHVILRKLAFHSVIFRCVFLAHSWRSQFSARFQFVWFTFCLLSFACRGTLV